MRKAGADTKGAILVRPSPLPLPEEEGRHIQHWPDLLPNEKQLIHCIVFRNAEDSIHIKEKMFQGFYTLCIFKCTELCLAGCHCPQRIFSLMWASAFTKSCRWGAGRCALRLLELEDAGQLRSGARTPSCLLPFCLGAGIWVPALTVPYPSKAQRKASSSAEKGPAGHFSQGRKPCWIILWGTWALAPDRLRIRVRSATPCRSQSFCTSLLPLCLSRGKGSLAQTRWCPTGRPSRLLLHDRLLLRSSGLYSTILVTNFILE